MMRTLLCLVFVLLASCRSEQSFLSPNRIEELHWVQFRQSSMPVVLAGNAGSDVIIVKIHGGPGASAIQEYQASDWVDAFENDYLMAYWDQPFAGYSRNSSFPDITALDLAHYRQALEVVVRRLNTIMPGKKIVFWGQSWGGLVLSDFITEPDLQSLYAGWINESGLNTNGYRDYMGLRASIMEEAERRISRGESRWITELEWMKQHPYDPSFKDDAKWDRYETYADELLGPFDPEPVPPAFARRERFLSDAADRKRLRRNLFEEPLNAALFAGDKIYFFDKDHMISNITRSGLFIQGRSDRSVSLKSSLEFARRSAPFTTMLVYDSSGHNPSYTERERFIRDVRRYLDSL
jgi:pimeloyl-ACP methyl ester carboxylesterase